MRLTGAPRFDAAAAVSVLRDGPRAGAPRGAADRIGAHPAAGGGGLANRPRLPADPRRAKRHCAPRRGVQMLRFLWAYLYHLGGQMTVTVGRTTKGEADDHDRASTDPAEQDYPTQTINRANLALVSARPPPTLIITAAPSSGRPVRGDSPAYRKTPALDTGINPAPVRSDHRPPRPPPRACLLAGNRADTTTPPGDHLGAVCGTSPGALTAAGMGSSCGDRSSPWRAPAAPQIVRLRGRGRSGAVGGCASDRSQIGT